MDAKPLDVVVRNIDARLTTVEQILPTLTTKKEFDEAVSRLATKEELREAVSRLATKEELREAVSRLATKEELREEEERTRRHFDVVAERLEGQIRLMAEAITARPMTDVRINGAPVRRDGLSLWEEVTR